MIFALVVLTISAFVARARGGSLDNLSRQRFRGAPILLGALLIQLALDLTTPPWLGPIGTTAVLLATNLVVVFFLFVNRSHPGMLIVALGLALNVAVIVANGAMPVSKEALRVAGAWEPSMELTGKHELVQEETRLVWLADVIPIPETYQVLSIGDIVLAAGLARFVYLGTMRSPRGSPSNGPQGSVGSETL